MNRKKKREKITNRPFQALEHLSTPILQTQNTSPSLVFIILVIIYEFRVYINNFRSTPLSGPIISPNPYTILPLNRKFPKPLLPIFRRKHPPKII